MAKQERYIELEKYSEMDHTINRRSCPLLVTYVFCTSTSDVTYIASDNEHSFSSCTSN